MKTMSSFTTAIIDVSEDVLCGKMDLSSKYLAEELNSLGFVVYKITVLPRNENFVSFEIEQLYKQFDVVIVSSDTAEYEVCCKAVANTFNQELKTITVNNGQISIPSEARALLATNSLKQKLSPVIHLQGVFILNGPSEDRKLSFVKILKPYLTNYLKIPIFCKTFCIRSNNNLRQENCVAMLKDITNCNVEVKKNRTNSDLLMKVTSTSFVCISQFVENFTQKINCDLIESEWKVEWNGSVDVENELHLKKSLESIEKCLTEYGPENIFVSFNGGKDCTVLLHLILMVLKKKFPDFKKPLFCVYIQSTNPFQEQNDFISQCKAYYNLDIMTISKGMKEALELVLKEKPYLKACLMGTRRSDPYSQNLLTFQMTDLDWPQLMRVNPLLDWHYSDIWNYLLYFKIPYCKLYNMGYTSIGNTSNTIQNPSLLSYDVLSGKNKYLPAYKLQDASQERHGRL